MAISDWLDIAIGVVTVWFLFSLVVSATNEAINKILAIRARQLWDGLRQLLDGTDGRGIGVDAFALPFLASRPTTATNAGNAGGIAERLYATASVQALETDSRLKNRTRIAHLPPVVFTHGIVELLGTNASEIEGNIDKLPGPLKTQFQALWATADGKASEFAANLEKWFDGQMSRVTALYRAKLRIILAIIGVVVAFGAFGFGLRSDAFGLVSDLQTNGDLRAALVTTAGQLTTNDLAAKGCPTSTTSTPAPTTTSSTTSTTLDTATCQLIGVSRLKGLDLHLQADSDRPGVHDNTFGRRLGFLRHHPKALLGVLVTGGAISFGSSFWYNALTKLLGMRSASGSKSS